MQMLLDISSYVKFWFFTYSWKKHLNITWLETTKCGSQSSAINFIAKITWSHKMLGLEYIYGTTNVGVIVMISENYLKQPNVGVRVPKTNWSRQKLGLE